MRETKTLSAARRNVRQSVKKVSTLSVHRSSKHLLLGSFFMYIIKKALQIGIVQVTIKHKDVWRRVKRKVKGQTDEKFYDYG